MDNHLIFYDGECGFCHHSIQILYNLDKNRLFLYAPLQGETAKSYPLPQVDSLILLENFKTAFIKGKAILRILSLLYPSLNFLNNLPAFLVNPPYDLIAYLRTYFFKQPTCLIPANLDLTRFLK
jgi:predicted DCC family thiol-disulfide oxidoreductase YuxK